MISYNVSLKSFVQLFLEYILFVDICCTKLYFNQPKGGAFSFFGKVFWLFPVIHWEE